MTSAAEPLELDLTSEPEGLPAVRDLLRQWLTERGWSEQQVHEIVLAVDEALSNVIRHGYENTPGRPIHMRLREITDAEQGGGLEICIRDYGRQVDPTQICGRDLDDVRPGGLGVHIIRSMMSTACYQIVPEGGMQLTMLKYRSHVAAVPDHRDAPHD